VRVKTYGWKAVALASGALAGVLTQRVLGTAWKATRGGDSPPLPADRRSSWTDALTWAVASGVGAGVARLVALRTAARVWEAAIHEPPPDAGLSSETSL
jgi:hypothetical protein